MGENLVDMRSFVAGMNAAKSQPDTGAERLRGELDIRQIRVLKTLLSESSVSRAASLHGLSQPGVSLTLRRFRQLTGDPLLVRAGTGLVRTPRADDIVAVVDRILDDVDHLVGRETDFDPASSNRSFRLIAATSFGPILMPRLIRRLRQHAPGMTLEVSPMPSPAALQQFLEAGEVDLVLAHRLLHPEKLRGEWLLDCDMVCMLDRGHPIAGASAITLAQYLELEHLSPNPPYGAAASPIDGRLTELGLSRRIRVNVSEYSLVPSVLRGGDLVFTSARPFANHFACLYDFAILDAPEEIGRMHFYLQWHERVHHSTFNAWLRALVKDCVLTADQTGED